MILPVPDSISLTRSEKLTQHIRDEMKMSEGWLTFARFMELVLYTPELGYYCSSSPKLGRGGDFITAPLVSPLFAQCIARQCQEVLAELPEPVILEIGAGTGKMASDLLLALEKMDCLPHRYFIHEKSDVLRRHQQTLLKETCSHLLSLVEWVDTFPEMNGVIIANEVLDAMPVHCFHVAEHAIQERSVIFDENHFRWHLTTPSQELLEAVQPLQLSAEYDSEINLNLTKWLSSLSKTLKKGCIFLLDYGYGRREYYHPDRTQGTLMCYYQHHRHSDPFVYVGLQDITAHVDFTQVVESALDAGLSLSGYTTQAAFLLACGLLTFAEKNSLSAVDHYQQNQAIKLLTLPSQMGESIKVMALSKNWNQSLTGFVWQDRRRDL